MAIAAEAITAAQFARCGCYVVVQYGANQPQYVLVVTKGDRMVKVSVKSSQDGAWDVVQSCVIKSRYHGAMDYRLGRHGQRAVLCFVRFKEVRLDEMPRVYLAPPEEVALDFTRAPRK